MEQIWLHRMVILRSGERSCASDILNWLESKRILPDVDGANDTCSKGNLDILKWLVGKGILPDVNGANLACLNGHLDILKWLADLPQVILPNVNGANNALQNGLFDILELDDINRICFFHFNFSYEMKNRFIYKNFK